MNNLKYIFRVLTTPSCWAMISPYNEEWDGLLKGGLEKGAVKVVDKYEAHVGECRVWIGNYPYAFGEPYKNRGTASFRPARETIFMLYDTLKNHEKSEVGRIIEESKIKGVDND